MQKLVPVKTQRLTIREFTDNDLEAVFDTLGPTTSGGRIFEKKTRTQAQQWLNNRITEQKELGYSIWAVEARTGEVVGVCGLIPWDPAPMICYAIRYRFQGKGFGTEAAAAVIKIAAQEFGQVIATINNSNTASIRVAEKIGMRQSDDPFSKNPTLRSFLYP